MRKVALNSVCKIIGGYAFKSSLMQSTPEKYQVVKMSNLYRGDFDLSRNSSYLKEINDRERHFLLKDGDILITLTGTVGKRDYGYSVLVKNSHNLLLNQRVCLIRPDHSRTDARFLLSVLQSRRFLDLFFASSIGGTGNQTNVSIVDLGELQINIPESLGEQKQIADYFETWDAAIEKTEALIDAKERQFWWLSKKMLGRYLGVRTARLGDIAEISSGGTPKSTVAEYYGGSIPWVSIADITEQGMWIETTQRTLTKDGLENSSAKIYPKNTVLYAMYASIGECGVASVDLSSSQAILGIIPDKGKLYYKYLYYYLSSLKNKIKLQGQWGTQSNLNAGIVKAFSVPLPSLAKQKSIAHIFSTAQQEIILLKKLVDQYRTQKRGLMQRLLIGC